MKTIDTIFEILFARYRRKLGEANLESAWRSACNKVSGYLVLPIAAVTTIMLIIAYSVRGLGAPISNDDKRLALILGGGSFLAIMVLLDRRFRKYLSPPPTLAPEESRDERLLVFRFRAIAMGMFALACLMGILWRELESNS